MLRTKSVLVPLDPSFFPWGYHLYRKKGFMICLKIIPRFFCLTVNQLLFALSKRLVLQVPNLQLILATNWIIIFTIKKKNNNKYKRHYKTRYYWLRCFLELSKKVLTRSEKFSHANKDWFTVFPLFISCKLICNLNLNIYWIHLIGLDNRHSLCISYPWIDLSNIQCTLRVRTYE